MWIIWIIGLALIVAGGVSIYNLGTSSEVISVSKIIPPIFEIIAGGIFIKFGSKKE